MNHLVAEQIADLLNGHNQLEVSFTPEAILSHQDSYIVRVADGTVVGVVKVTKVQWYHCEISHLCVSPDNRRHGVAKELLRAAEEKARHAGAKIAQCTIRANNEASLGFFHAQGYMAGVVFFNSGSGNRVATYQKVL